MHILIADDSKNSRDVIHYLIQKQISAKISEASNGLEALKIIREDCVNILITDIKMPKMDGLELIEEAHRTDANLQMIVLSAFGNFDYAKKALQIGVTNYLLKPISADEFCKTLNLVISKFRNIQNQNIWNQLEDVVSAKSAEDIEWPDSLNDYSALTLIEPDCSAVSDISSLDTIIRSVYPASSIMHRESGNLMILIHKNDPFNARTAEDLYQKISVSVPCSLYSSPFEHSVESLKNCCNSVKNYATDNHFWELDPKSYFISEPYGGVRKSLSEFFRQAEIIGKQITACDAETNQNLDQFFTCMKDGGLSSKQCKYIITEMIKSVFLYMPTQISFENIIESVNLTVCVSELKQNIRNFCNRILSLSKCNTDNSNQSQAIRAALQIIHNEYMKDLNRDEIAVRLFMSSSYFSHQFKSETGENFTSYLNNYRLDKAAELLRKTDSNISYIAKSVGFINYPYFCAQFKKKFKLTCLQYRDSYFK